MDAVTVSIATSRVAESRGLHCTRRAVGRWRPYTQRRCSSPGARKGAREHRTKVTISENKGASDSACHQDPSLRSGSGGVRATPTLPPRLGAPFERGSARGPPQHLPQQGESHGLARDWHAGDARGRGARGGRPRPSQRDESHGPLTGAK